MLTPNMHYSELKDSYLFNTIYRKTAEYQSSHPDEKIYRMGVLLYGVTPKLGTIIKLLKKS